MQCPKQGRCPTHGSGDLVTGQSFWGPSATPHSPIRTPSDSSIRLRRGLAPRPRSCPEMGMTDRPATDRLPLRHLPSCSLHARAVYCELFVRVGIDVCGCNASLASRATGAYLHPKECFDDSLVDGTRSTGPWRLPPGSNRVESGKAFADLERKA